MSKLVKLNRCGDNKPSYLNLINNSLIVMSSGTIIEGIITVRGGNGLVRNLPPERLNVNEVAERERDSER